MRIELFEPRDLPNPLSNAVFGPFRSRLGSKTSPLASLTLGRTGLATRADGEPSWLLTGNDVEQVQAVHDLLTLVVLAKRNILRPFSDYAGSEVTDYFAWSGVDPSTDRLPRTIHTLSTAINISVSGGDIATWLQPPTLVDHRRLEPDVALATALAACKGSAPGLWTRLNRSAAFFRLLSRDEGRHNQSGLLLAAAAFEHLIEPDRFAGKERTPQGVKAARGLLAALVVHPWTRGWLPLQRFGRVLHDPERFRRHCLHRPTERWLYDLFEARNNVAHPVQRQTDWSADEHIVLAAHYFPLAVKAFLAEAGCWDWSKQPCDAADVQNFDRIVMAKTPKRMAAMHRDREWGAACFRLQAR